MNIGIILSGGSGTRFGNALPKQYHELLGKKVISYSVDALTASQKIDAVIVVADPEFISEIREKYSVVCIPGGNTRNQSLRYGLEYIRSTFPNCEKVFITEAARPFLTTEIVDTYLSSLDEYDAVITTKQITDSLGRIGEAVTMREEYYLIQAPEAFCFSMLYEHFQENSPITATVQQLPAERKVLNYYDFRHNLKITYPEDLVMAEHLMRTYEKETEARE